MSYYDNYGYGAYDVVEESTSFFGGIMLIIVAIGIFSLVCMWKLFKKAGKNGWECLIPIYNIIVMLEIAALPTWYIILFFIPFANIYAMFKLYIELAHKFGQSTGFGVAMVFFPIICIPILALGKAEYQGGMTSQTNMNQNYGYQNSGQPVNPQPVQPQNANNFDVSMNQQVAPVAPAQEQTMFPNATDIPQPNNNQVKFCPNCGNKCAMNADTCFMCGHKFNN